MPETSDLNGTWSLRWNDGQRGERLGDFLQPVADTARAIPAQVPGEVHLDLMKAGLLAEPATGLNCLHARWVEETLWLYRRTFQARALAPGERAFLLFQQLDLVATVYLNGVEVGRHANAFHPLRLDVTGKLREGENVLVVEVESGLFSVSERPWQGYGVTRDGRLHKRHWLRKTQSSFAWDWSQRLVNVGISGGVALEICRDVRVDAAAAVARLEPDLRTGSVTGRFVVEGFDAPTRTGRLTVEVEGLGRRGEAEVEIKPGLNSVEATVAVEDPELWWPIGHGAQPLYDVRLSLAVDGAPVTEATRRVGFRHVRVNQDPHPKGGRWFVLEVNGKPIFCKGGNLVPADLIFRRMDRARYATLVDRAVEANFNLLRVWGGGLYESDDFYNLCDARGVLVWQEFIFACAKYPVTDEAFLADVKREAAWQVRRLAHHPSLAIWCGNNELEWGGWSWNYDKGVAHPDYALFHMVLPRIVRQEDGSRYYHPSSPFSPDGEHPNADHTGDQHPWTVGFDNTDFRDYRRMTCRFPNEGGILGPTALPTIKVCLAPGQDRIGSFAWEVHDNSIAFRGASDRMLDQWLGKTMRDMSLEEYCYYGGLLQGLGLAEYIRNFRRRMFDSASAIFWMYNDSWPVVRSWTIVDYYQRRTPSFHPVRRALAPLAVALAAEEGTVKVFVVNEGSEVSADVRFGLFALAGGFPVDNAWSGRIPANASTLVGRFPESEWQRRGLFTHGAFAILSLDGRPIAQDVFFLPFYKELTWPKAEVSVRQDRGRAVFESPTFAWRVCLDLDGSRALPDNFFDLLPGVPYALDWPESLGAPRVLRVANL